jgi:hypothetical protein
LLQCSEVDNTPSEGFFKSIFVQCSIDMNAAQRTTDTAGATAAVGSAGAVLGFADTQWIRMRRMPSHA